MGLESLEHATAVPFADYVRYDPATELDTFDEIWDRDRTFTNYLLSP